MLLLFTEEPQTDPGSPGPEETGASLVVWRSSQFQPAEPRGEGRPHSNTMDAEEYRIKGEQGGIFLTSHHHHRLIR